MLAYTILKGIGTVIVLGGFVYWLFLPTPTPGCDEKGIQNSLFRISSEMDREPRMMSSVDSISLIFLNPTELSYNKETGIRACMASVFASNVSMGKNPGFPKDTGEKLGFTIERERENNSKFIVRIVPIENLMSRNAIKGTANKNPGAPVGRKADKPETYPTGAVITLP